jgi:RHS repeat-associated protein
VRGGLRRGRSAGGASLERCHVLMGLFASLVVTLGLMSVPASALADPLCTDTWTGPSEGKWASAEDWSTGVPTSSSVVCIGAGKTVTIREEGAYAGVLEDDGGLSVEFGWIDITNALEPSSVGVLTMEDGSLIGPASLAVATSMYWGDNATISAGGSLIIQPGASATIYGSVEMSEAAKLINEGTVTFPATSSGTLSLSEGAEVRNAGTFNANSDLRYPVEIEERGAEPRFVNTGTLQTSLTDEHSTGLGIDFYNEGVVNAGAGELVFSRPVESRGANTWESEGGRILFRGASQSLTEGEWIGSVVFEDSTATVEGVDAKAAQVIVTFATLSVPSGTVSMEKLSIVSSYSKLGGAGSVAVSKVLEWSYAELIGTGSLILRPGGTGTISGGDVLNAHTLVNEGSINFEDGNLTFEEGATLNNDGTFTANDPTGGIGGESHGTIVNAGIFQITIKGTVDVHVVFENDGSIREENEGKFNFSHPVTTEASNQNGGPGNPSRPGQPCPICGEPVVASTGDLVETQTDVAVGGRGVGLDLTRTYNSQAASKRGAFGYGWASSFSDYLELVRVVEVGFPTEWMELRLHQATGSTVTLIYHVHTGVSEAVGSQDHLSVGEEVIVTLPNQTKYKFACACSTHARLESVTDRDGNTTTLSYGEHEELTTITDPDGRKVKLTYNGEGLVERVEDPMGHVVEYAYEGENLASVTLPGEASPRWQFKYDGSHELTEMIDGRGGKTTNEYSAGRVVSQTDPTKRTLHFEYEPFQTRITNESTGSVTDERFTSSEEPSSITRGYGTASATTESFTYDNEGDITSQTNGDGQATKYGYDSKSNRTSMVDPDGHETKWTYDSTHDVLTTTTPDGETTTIKRESDGNPETVSRPSSGGTETTSYEYDSHGDVTSIENPLKQVWTYEYDSAGDRTGEVDPEGDKRTWAYNGDSQETATVSPRGNVSGGEPTKFTTTIERDAQGRPVAVTEPETTRGEPVSKVGATVSGAPQEGQTLTADVGIWEGAPSLSYSYQWEACNTAGGECFDVSGATGATLSLTSEGIGYTLRVAVTATNGLGSATSISAATAVVLASPPLVFASAFGSGGSGAGQFDGIGGIAIDSHGDLWVTDRYNDRIEKFSSSGSLLATYGKLGIGDGEYIAPVGIAINQSTGNVYVADQGNDRVQELNESGEWIRSWYGSEGEFNEPTGVAVNAEGDVFVTDYGNDRVEKFNETGGFLLKFGSAGFEGGQFLSPAGIAVANSYVYVTDLTDARLEAFTEEGEYVGEVGEPGIGVGQFYYPAGLAVDSSGNIYLADLANDRVQELGRYGNFLSTFGVTGSGAGELSEPTGVAVSSAGAVFVADSANGRIEKWVPPAAPVSSAAPSISGLLVVGQALTAGSGVWSAAPSPTYTYQWERCSPVGGGCTGISGATGDSYTVTTSDIGHALRVNVTATNTDGSASSASVATDVEPAQRTTEYTYDPDGDLVSITDPEGHRTSYSYNEDDELTKTEEPDGTTTETEYNGEGQSITQTDGEKHATKYTRNVLGEITEETDPLGHVTSDEYDKAGNLTAVKDADGRTTSYKYDPANHLTEVSYSDGETPSVKYEYNGDGERTKMTDGTGESTYSYDQLDRLTETKDGHGDTVKYEYNLADEPTEITYPNGKSVSRTYDNDGRLESVTDWSGNTTKFAYDPDSELASTAFPAESGDEDVYAYNDADAMSEVTMKKSSETLASLTYTRNRDDEVAKASSSGLPGEAEPAFSYDQNGRLTEGASTTYGYDAANNPTAIATDDYSYNAGDELETSTKEGTPTAIYSYDDLGQRTEAAPASGPATSYAYNQAGELTAVTRLEEGASPAIEGTYTYNGEGLRTSQTIAGTTSYFAWDVTEELPLILSDGTNSYVYGPGGLPIEQINNSTGTVTYLHHDQADSTRLLTGSSGTVTGKCTYSAYGTPTCEGTTTTPLGYDGQYTSSDTGLIYMRARTYDPATAQFLSVDPLAVITGEPYTYAGDNPLAYGDPSGEGLVSFLESAASTVACGFGGSEACADEQLVVTDAKVVYNDVDAILNPCRATEDREKSIADVLGASATIAGSYVLPGVENTIPEEGKALLEKTLAGRNAMRLLGGLNGAASSLAGSAVTEQVTPAKSSSCGCEKE